MAVDTSGMAARLAAVRGRVATACERAGRDPGDVTLVGASKLQPVELLAAAYDAGLRVFGENRVQEAQAKAEALPTTIDWHLLGPLQSNKVKAAADLFGTVHSVGRLKIARLLDRAAAERDRRILGFIEVNVGEEESKHGFSPGNLTEAVRPLADLESLSIVGLMAIPPWHEEPEAMRPWFRRLRELRDRLAARPEWSDFPGQLSMGMSSDFEVAIAEGATHVRIGTDLFGPRPER